MAGFYSTYSLGTSCSVCALFWNGGWWHTWFRRRLGCIDFCLLVACLSEMAPPVRLNPSEHFQGPGGSPGRAYLISSASQTTTKRRIGLSRCQFLPRGTDGETRGDIALPYGRFPIAFDVQLVNHNRPIDLNSFPDPATGEKEGVGIYDGEPCGPATPLGL